MVNQFSLRICYDCSFRMKGSFPHDENTYIARCNICQEERYTNPYTMTFETLAAPKEEERNPAEYTDGVQHLSGDGPACCD